MSTKTTQQNKSHEWQTLSVGDVFKFVRTHAFSRENLKDQEGKSESIGNIHYGDIHSKFFASSIDLTKTSIPVIKDSSFSPDPDDLLKDGDLVMADASEDYEGVGVTVSVHGLNSKKVVGGLHTYVLRDEKNFTDKYFRQYIFRNPEIRNLLQKIANGVSVYSISKSSLAKVLLSIPSCDEQKRIASILQTWDHATEKLKREIEIKKEVKKGLMQELLTGKRRAKGFTDKWLPSEISGFCEISRGGSPRPIQDYMTEDKDGLNWLKIGDVPKGSRYITKTTGKIKREGLNKTTVVNEGDFILSNSMSFGRPYIMKLSACIHDGWLALKNISPKVNKDFLYYLLSSEIIQAKFKSISAGSGVLNLKKETVAEVVIHLPSLKEQNLIAKVLGTADDEIDELNKKLELLKDQKKYLLNNLVTGKIRTPETLSTNK